MAAEHARRYIELMTGSISVVRAEMARDLLDLWDNLPAEDTTKGAGA